jgi:hypothetical protein
MRSWKWRSLNPMDFISNEFGGAEHIEGMERRRK